MDTDLLIPIALGVLLIVTLTQIVKIVPQRSAFVIERLGKYTKTLEAGLHILLPFIDRVAYKHSLKELASDVPEQACITKDNITVTIDGVLYLQIINPKDASYGIENLRYAATQLAQTTLRSVIGKTDLDKTFEERESINTKVVEALDQAAANWGVKVLRYEIADIKLPPSISDAMEKQMRAERERRAVVAKSEGDREAMINVSEGQKQETINLSKAEQERQINVATGRAEEITLVATATAKGIEAVAAAIEKAGGKEAVSLRIAEQYVAEFGKLAKESTTLILPAELANIGSAVAAFSKILESGKTK
jgi:regulator of protease activity HflC (stomatin/prohibitin superfamily)